MKSNVFIQLVVNERIIWQVKQDVPPELCRRMSQVELAALGRMTREALKKVMEEPEASPSLIEDTRVRRVKGR